MSVTRNTCTLDTFGYTTHEQTHKHIFTLSVTHEQTHKHIFTMSGIYAQKHKKNIITMSNTCAQKHTKNSHCQAHMNKHTSTYALSGTHEQTHKHIFTMPGTQ